MLLVETGQRQIGIAGAEITAQHPLILHLPRLQTVFLVLSCFKNIFNFMGLGAWQQHTHGWSAQPCPKYLGGHMLP